MEIFNRKTSIALLLLVIILACGIASISHAEAKTFEREYTYQASEADSKVTSRAIALEQVKRLLLEELGTYLESQTEVTNLQMTKDQITTLSAGITQTIILDESWDGKTYWMKAKIDVDPDKVITDLDNLRKDRQKAKDYEDLKKRADEALAEVEQLKEQLSEKESEKTRLDIANKINQETNKLTAKDWYEKSTQLGNAKDWEGAIDAINKAIEKDPKFAAAYNDRGVIKIVMGDYTGAISDYDKAIKINPKYAWAYVGRGAAKFGHGDYTGAISDYDKARKLDPKLTSNYYSGRGNVKFYLGDYIGAISDYDKAIKLYPRDLGSYSGRGSAKKALGDYIGAISDYNKAIELAEEMRILDSGNYLYYIKRGNAKKRLEDYAGALSDIDKAIEFNPKIASSYYYRGLVKTLLNDDNGAISDFDKAIELDPKYASAYYFRGCAKGRLGDDANAEIDIKTAARMGDKDAQKWLTKNGMSW